MSKYRLDRTRFSAQSSKKAADHFIYYKELTWQESLRIAFYLNSIAFNYPQNEPPGMDRTKFKARSRNI